MRSVVVNTSILLLLFIALCSQRSQAFPTDKDHLNFEDGQHVAKVEELVKGKKVQEIDCHIENTTTTGTSSCGDEDGDEDEDGDGDSITTVEEHIEKISELVQDKKGVELQNYVESITNFRDVWFVMDRHLVLDMISLVPQADEMVKAWDVDIIGSLFITFMNQRDEYEELKAMLPLSFQIAADNYSVLRTTTATTAKTTLIPITTTTKASTTSTTTTPIPVTTTTTTTTTTAATTTSTPSCGDGDGDSITEVAEHIAKIAELVQDKKGVELQNYVESIADFRDVWFAIDRHLVLDMLFLVPQADQMVKEWDVDIIGSLFITFIQQRDVYDRLTSLLPLSFQIAADNYSVFRNTTPATTTTTACTTTTTKKTTTSVPTTTTTTTTPMPTTTTTPTTTTSTATTTAATTTSTSSCEDGDSNATVEEHIAKISELVKDKRGVELRNYVESIANFREVWYSMDRKLILDMIFLVPQADKMVKAWDEEIIGSLFTTFMHQRDVYKRLKTLLPLSFKTAAEKYSLFTTTTSASTTKTTRTTTPIPIPITTATTTTTTTASTTRTTRTTTTPIPITTTTASTTTTTTTAANTIVNLVVDKRIAHIKDLLSRGDPEDLQTYMESIKDMNDIWWDGDVYLLLKVIKKVPRPDAMVQKWPQRAIGSLFTTFINQPKTFEYLKSILPKSFAIADEQYNLSSTAVPPSETDGENCEKTCSDCPSACQYPVICYSCLA